MHLIDRAYPIQVMALQIKWRKIFPLCSLQLFQKLLIHKEKNLRQRAKLLHGAAPDVLNWQGLPYLGHSITDRKNQMA